MKPSHAFALGVVLTAVAIFGARALVPDSPPDADLYERAIELVQEDLDSVIAVADSARAAAARSDSLTADSIARLTIDRDAAQARQRAAQAQVAELREAHVTTLDSAQVEAFRSYEAVRDSIDSAKDEIIESQAAEIALLYAQVQTWKELTAATEAERDIERIRADTERRFRIAETARANRATWQRNVSIAGNVALAIAGAVS